MVFSWIWTRLWPKQKHSRHAAQPTIPPSLEVLEDRTVPAPVTVSFGTDNFVPGAPPPIGTLRAAIADVNAGIANQIVFANNVTLVNLTAPLPAITRPVTIDGSTSRVQQVEISAGNAAAAKGNGLTFGPGSSGSQVQDLEIDGFTGGDGILLNNVSNILIGGISKAGVPTPGPTSTAVFNNDIGIEISGVNATANTVINSIIGTNHPLAGKGNALDGVKIDNGANRNTIGGLSSNELNVISNNGGSGVDINNANNNTLAGNLIGTDPTGKDAMKNRIGGVWITGSTGNHIGIQQSVGPNGPTSPVNLISGNAGYGVEIYLDSSQNFVEGDWIGVDITGKNPVPNTLDGVNIAKSNGNFVGGGPLGTLNVISGNKGVGISVEGSSQNRIQNNNIGIGPDPTDKTVQVGNGSGGISFDANSSGNLAKSNRIFNNKPGDMVSDLGQQNKTVDPNSSANNGFGIDTGTGADAPVLTSAVVSGNTIAIAGTLASTPNSAFTLEFFGNTVADPSGRGEGEFYLGNAVVNTDANGNASFNVSFNAVYGGYVSATATGNAATGHTSEFSTDIAIGGESTSAAVGGEVWNDGNADGLLESGESGIANINVQLFTSLGSLVASTNTDSTGHYRFAGLAAGSYYLQFTSPSGYTFTPAYEGDDTIDSHADSSGKTETFTLIAGEVDPFLNAGLIFHTYVPPPGTPTLISTVNPSLYGAPVTFIDSITPSTDQVPYSGYVTFQADGTTLGTVALVQDGTNYDAMLTTSSLAVGFHTITANFGGDGFHTANTASLTQTVTQAPSVTSVISSNTPALAGQPVTFTATVAAAAGTPTGSVTFLDGSTTLGSAPVDAYGHATFTTSSLALGSHTITANYGGDNDFLSSSGSLNQVISQEVSSSMTLNTSAYNAVPGQTVTFTASVSGNSGTPTGLVTFLDNTTVLGTAPLDANGNAAFSTSSLLLGSQTISAVYGGDATYGSSTASQAQNVALASSFTTLNSSGDPSPSGQPVTFTATVSSQGYAGALPTGTVTFLDGTMTLGTATLAVVNGQAQASLTVNGLSNGAHIVSAIYSSDGTFADSDGSLTQVVFDSPLMYPELYLSSSGSSASPGQAVTFTAMLSGSPMPSGSVTFLDGTTVLGTASVDANGQASFTTSTLDVGPHAILAVYSGDGSYNPSAATLTETVGQNGTYFSLTASANPSPQGQGVTFTATVSPSVMGPQPPSGTVTFYDGTTLLGTELLSELNGQEQATFITSAMGLGTHTILAVYSGDGTYSDGAGSIQETITS